MWKSRTKYLARVAGGLDKAYHEAAVEDVPVNEARIIVFSDLHRGTGDRADDFRPCRRIYHAALGYYGALDYRLFLLGDIEELWERLMSGIVHRYKSTLELEKRFFDRGRAVRFLGNHDDNLLWPWNRGALDRYTNDAPLREGLVLRFTGANGEKLGEMLFVHGHQGIGYTWFDRFVVKRLWVPVQKLTGLTVGTPSIDHGIRLTHELALYDWAARRDDLLLVCGHTHHPVFMSAAWEETLRGELSRLRKGGAAPEDVARKEAELHWAAADLDELRSELPPNPRPCYFNAGCCSFSDGSITGLEISGGRVRLVRWSGASGAPVRESLREADLTKLFGKNSAEAAE